MIRLALRNSVRHRFRSATTLAAVVVGVVALVLVGGFVRDIFIQLGEAIIHSQTGHLQIVRSGFLGSGSRSPEKYLLSDLEGLRTAASAMPETAEVMARLSFTGLLNNGRADIAIIGQGIESARETRLGSYLTILRGRTLADADRYGALVGEGVAQALQLAPGDHVVLLANTPDGALNTVDLDVVGVFRSFSKEFDARAVRIPLATAQDLVATSGANTLVVALRGTSETAAAAESLRRRLAGMGLEVRTWRELDDFYDKTVQLYRRQFDVLHVVILVMVLLSVVNTVNMSVFERTPEFGTMRALGNTGRRVFLLIVVECALVGLAGAALGALLAGGLAALLSAIGIPMPPPPSSAMAYTARIRLVPSVFAGAMAVGLAATLLASLMPAAIASRMPIAEALRRAI
ncbi:MAG: ABC transporter permease [Casimicrobiaceae bacterium]